MYRRTAGSLFAVALATVVMLALALPAGASGHTWSQDFETDTAGWNDSGSGTVHREASGYTNSGGYADGIDSAAGDWHGRLRTTQTGGCAPPFAQNTSCGGPFTGWGKATTNNADFPAGGYVTQVDVYLDTDWATGNPDWRFDFSSAINNSDGDHLRDFVFNVGTTGAGFVVGASTNAFRSNSFPANPCPSPSAAPNTCRVPATIATSGWYTLRHDFHIDDDVNAGKVSVDMSILDASGNTVASWTIHETAEVEVGGDRYGWFANQEIHDLAIDNSSILRRAAFPTPASADDCKDGGWESRTDDDGGSFKNQGECIRYVNTGKAPK